MGGPLHHPPTLSHFSPLVLFLSRFLSPTFLLLPFSFYIPILLLSFFLGWLSWSTCPTHMMWFWYQNSVYWFLILPLGLEYVPATPSHLHWSFYSVYWIPVCHNVDPHIWLIFAMRTIWSVLYVLTNNNNKYIEIENFAAQGWVEVRMGHIGNNYFYVSLQRFYTSVKCLSHLSVNWPLRTCCEWLYRAVL